MALSDSGVPIRYRSSYRDGWQVRQNASTENVRGTARPARTWIRELIFRVRVRSALLWYSRRDWAVLPASGGRSGVDGEGGR